MSGVVGDTDIAVFTLDLSKGWDDYGAWWDVRIVL